MLTFFRDFELHPRLGKSAKKGSMWLDNFVVLTFRLYNENKKIVFNLLLLRLIHKLKFFFNYNNHNNFNQNKLITLFLATPQYYIKIFNKN